MKQIPNKLCWLTPRTDILPENISAKGEEKDGVVAGGGRKNGDTASVFRAASVLNSLAYL